MAQISKGDTFTDGQQVTGSRLNQLIDSATILVNVITDQTSITPNTLQATDSTIVNDAGVLREATVGDFLNSNLPISTSSITGGAGVDIVLTPAAGQKFDIAGNLQVIGNDIVLHHFRCEQRHPEANRAQRTHIWIWQSAQNQ